MRGRLALASIGLASLTGSASALDQDEHAQLTKIACESVGLTTAFCERVADEAYNTDHHEFADPYAHATPAPGDTACQTLDHTFERLITLGASARAGLRRLQAAPADANAAADVATAMGRALHTIEDNCAHEGMPNPQHAWHSLSDTCEGTAQSPDVQVEASVCAERQARLAFMSLDRAATALGVNRALMAPSRTSRRYPPRGQVCEFLHEAADWDGLDRRWNSLLVITALNYQFDQALTVDGAVAPSSCAASIDLSRTDLHPSVDTSAGLSFCTKVQAYCVGTGKADGDEAPPWDNGTGPADKAAGGCAADHDASPLLIVLGLGTLLLRRRRAHLT